MLPIVPLQMTLVPLEEGGVLYGVQVLDDVCCLVRELDAALGRHGEEDGVVVCLHRGELTLGRDGHTGAILR